VDFQEGRSLPTTTRAQSPEPVPNKTEAPAQIPARQKSYFPQFYKIREDA